MGNPGSVASTNPLKEASVAIPLVGPLGIPIAAAGLYDVDWFLPAFMAVMEAHYLPFSHPYGMRVFIPLGAGMWLAGLAFGLWRRPGRCRGGFHRGCLARRGGEGGGLQTRGRCPVRASLPGLSSLL